MRRVLTVLGTLSALATSILVAGDTATFVSETIPDGTQESAGQTYLKTWTIRNSGTTTWNSSYSLQYVSGNAGCNHNTIPLSITVVPSSSVIWTVPCNTPASAGTYREDWRMVGPSGTIPVSGSSTIWVQITVVGGGGGGSDAATFVSETIPDGTQESAGQTYLKTWTIRNSGTTTWNSSYSLQYVSGNAGCNHNTIPLSITVVPSSSVIWTVPCNAPASAGTYREDWRMVGPSGTIPVSGSSTIWVQITVVGGGGGGSDAATFVSETIPDGTQESAGQTYLKTWTIRNSGTTTWNSSYSLQYVSGNAGCNHNTIPLSITVVPSSSVIWTVPCNAPASAGTYREDWRMVGPSGTIPVSGSSTIWVQITVVGGGGGGSDAATFVSETIPDGTQESAGQIYLKTWTIRNSGTTTWNSSYSLQYVSGNAGCNHNTIPLSITVVPSSSVIWTVPCNAPASAGTYREDWRMVGPSGTIPVSGSSTIWVQITVVGGGGGGSDAATFVSETIPDGTQESAGQTYLKTWTIRNSGTTTWNSSYSLQYVSGNAGCNHNTIPLSITVVPSSSVIWTVPCNAPASAGTYREDWRMVGPSGTIPVSGSSTIWVQITVVGGGGGGSDAATFVSETIPDGTQESAGQTYLKTWTIRNSGTTTWNSSYSLQYVSGNAGCNHNTIPLSITVVPSSSVIWTVPCNAPASAGTYREDWRMVGPSGTIPVSGSSTIWVQITVVGGGGGGSDAATFVSETIPDGTQESAGQTYLKTWTIRNSGTTTWNSSYSLQYVSGNAGCNHNTIPLSITVVPSSSVIWTVPCNAPASAGTYREDWRMVGPSGTIPVSGSSTIWVQITVVGGGGGGSDAATFVSETIPDGTQESAGQTYLKTWTIRNSGTTTWNSSYSLQYVSGNAGCNHNTIPLSITVVPSSSVIWTVPCNAPASAGTYREDWRMVGPSGTIPVSGSSTIWVQITVPGGGGGGSNTLPESAHPYSINYDNTWTYTLPASATAISVTFDPQTFVEQGYDYIYVMDGSGNNIAGSPFTAGSLAGQTKTVPGNTVKIRLTSDVSVTYWGFKVTSVTAAGGGGGGSGSDAATFVSETIPDGTQESAGQIYSKTWTIRNSGTTTWNSSYSLQYVSGNAGCNHSTISISGTVSPANNTTFTIQCNAPATAGNYREDWRLVGPLGTIPVSGSSTVWVQITVPGGGGGGSNTLPESAHPYSINYDNTWTYTLPASATAISVTFDPQTFVEQGYDYIYVMDGSGNNIAGSPFTAGSLAGQTKTVPGNTVKIRLTSDVSVTYWGFKVTSVTAAGGGGGGSGSDAATFVSETIPDGTQESAGQIYSKTWTIRNSGTTTWNSSYSLQYVSGNAGCNHSTISISGTVSPANNTTFTIQCNAPATAGNYREDWRLVGPLGTIPVSGSSTVWVQITVPGGGGGGSNTLPESAHPYSINYDNTWTYTLPASATAISVTFDPQTFVEQGYDYIYVMDGSGNNIAGSPFTAGSLAGQTKTVPGNTVKIRLTSDYSVTYWGFKVTSVTVASSGSLNTMVFLVHGLSQRGGALSGLKANLTSGTQSVDMSRFEVDDGFDWPCADTNACTDHITEGGRKLATYISQQTADRPTAPIILVGYSLGGLVTRDLMLNNYDNVLTTRRVAAYITLGTPLLGYPYLPIDTLLKPDGPIKDMAGDFINSAASLRSHWDPFYDDPYTADLFDNGNSVTLQRVATSNYLFDLNTRWSTSSFLGKPTYWLAAAGRAAGPSLTCTGTRPVDTSISVGCPASNLYSDGVVCDQSARYVWDASNGPNERWFDQDGQYHHTGSWTTYFAICSGSGARIPLFDPTGALLQRIKEVIDAAH